jgi:hypothetical protein
MKLSDFLNGIFHSKADAAPAVKVEVPMNVAEPKSHEDQWAERISQIQERAKNSYPSQNGLFPQEIFMLSYAHKYKVEGNYFPKFWYYEFGIENPQDTLNDLHTRGFIEVATPFESLDNLKLPELKSFLSAFQLPTSGKKADVINRIKEKVPEDWIANKIPDRYFKLTELGQAELKANEYVTYFGASVKYGLNVWDMNQMLQNYPKKLFRDKIWSTLNKNLNDAAVHASNENDLYWFYHDTAFVYGEMCEFLVEEHRNSIGALELWAQSVYYNFYVETVYRYAMNLKFGTVKSSFREMLYIDYKSFRALKADTGLSDAAMLGELENQFKAVTIAYDRINPDRMICKLTLSDAELAKLILLESNEDTEHAADFYRQIEHDIENAILNSNHAR